MLSNFINYLYFIGKSRFLTFSPVTHTKRCLNFEDNQ